MKLRLVALILTLALGLLAASVPAEGKVYRIGFLLLGYRSPYYEVFSESLRELGYVDYKNFVTEKRDAAGDRTLLADLAAELVRLNVDLIVADSTPAALAAKSATGTIPVVAIAGDPVASGLVTSLARPGGNVTGLATLTPQLSAKRLELLKEAAPEVSRVAVLWDVTEPDAAPNLKAMQVAGRTLGVELLPLEVRGSRDFDSAFVAVTKNRADALIVTLASDPIGYPPAGRILDFAAENRVPAMYSWSGFVDAGGLVAYGPDFNHIYRRAATYVDKILKGVKTADLPVEQPTKFDFVLNMKTAKALGLTIPPSVLFRADRVIK